MHKKLLLILCMGMPLHAMVPKGLTSRCGFTQKKEKSVSENQNTALPANDKPVQQSMSCDQDCVDTCVRCFVFTSLPCCCVAQDDSSADTEMSLKAIGASLLLYMAVGMMRAQERRH